MTNINHVTANSIYSNRVQITTKWYNVEILHLESLKMHYSNPEKNFHLTFFSAGNSPWGASVPTDQATFLSINAEITTTTNGAIKTMPHYV